MGFKGNKEPDIDLNFAGISAVAHRYVGTIFGEKNVFKAGTVGTVAEKTAYGYVAKFFEERDIPVNKYEKERLAQHCTGVKRTTGQHPGGIVICPDDHEIYEFCPVQHPANDTTTDIITTHFDYHKIDENLLKLDILGHDVPSMIRQLQDMTGTDPLQIDLTDRKVLSSFYGTRRWISRTRTISSRTALTRSRSSGLLLRGRCWTIRSRTSSRIWCAFPDFLTGQTFG